MVVTRSKTVGTLKASLDRVHFALASDDVAQKLSFACWREEQLREKLLSVESFHIEDQTALFEMIDKNAIEWSREK